MGMFDRIIDVEILCPICSGIITEFQTKDLSNGLSDYTVSEIPKNTKFYSYCNQCDTECIFIKGNLKQQDVNWLLKEYANTKK